MAYALPLGAALLSVPFYIHLLGTPRYGIFVLIIAFSNYACFLDLGFGKAAAYFLARFGNDPSKRGTHYYGVALCFCTLVSVTVASASTLASPWLVKLLPTFVGASKDELYWSVVFGCATIPTMALITFLTGAYQGVHRFHRLSAILGGSGVILQLMPLLACAIFGARLNVALSTVFAVRFITVLMLIATLRDAMPWRAFNLIEREPLKEMLKFGRWPAVLSLLGAILTTGDRIVISAVVGPAALAAYSVPFDLANRLMIISGSVANTIFPLLASDEGGMALRVQRTREAVLGLLTPIMVTVILAMFPFLQLWVGKAIAEQSRMIGEIIICGVWLSAVAGLSYSRLLAERRGKIITVNYLFQLIPFFLGIYWGALFFGIIGCAIVWAARCAVDAIVMIYFARDGTGVIKPLVMHGSLLMLALSTAALTSDWTVRLASLAVFIPVCLLVSRSQIALVFSRIKNG